MGITSSQDIERTYGVDVRQLKANKLAPEQVITVTTQMAGFTTPRRVVKGMQFFGDNVKIQRAGAKQLSNLAFNVENVGSVLQNNGLSRLMKAIKSHKSDWKLCWFGASAIWNMARPAEARLDVGASITLLIDILVLHQQREQVAHTVLGALSNLALEEANAAKMISDDDRFYKLIFKTLEMHNGSRSVMTSALGLIANLAIRESIASELAALGAVNWVVKGLKLFIDNLDKFPVDTNNPENDTQMMLVENGMAALSNITFVDAFPRFFLKAFGLEVLCKIMRSESDVPLSEEEDLPLLRNILESIGVSVTQIEDSDCDLYSFHQTVKMNFEDDKKMIPQILAIDGQENLLNIADGAGMTPLRYAIYNKNKNLAELLITSGAEIAPQDLEGCDDSLKTFVKLCRKTYESMLFATKAGISTTTELNSDLSGVVVDFLSKFELRNTFGGNPQWA